MRRVLTGGIHTLAVIRSFEGVRRLAARVLPDYAPPLARPHFALFEALALGTSLLLLLAPTWPLFLGFVPMFLLACRYHELAYYSAVRRSRWLLLLVLVTASATVAWTIGHPSGPTAILVHVTFAVVLLAAGSHIWSTQQRLARAGGRHVQVDGGDEEAPLWFCGGLLAAMPTLFVLGFVSGFLSWRSPLFLAWGIAALPLLVLQLRCHPAFPRAAIAWLVAFFVMEVVLTLPASETQEDDLFVTAAIGFVVVPLAIYLEFHPRVRRTFESIAAAPVDDTIFVIEDDDEGTADERPAAAPGSGRRGKSIPA